jgi:hypothetical protein
MRQIDEVQVRVATSISQTFLLYLNGTEVNGSPVPGQVSLSNKGNVLNLLMTEECIADDCPSYELVSLIQLLAILQT